MNDVWVQCRELFEVPHSIDDDGLIFGMWCGWYIFAVEHSYESPSGIFSTFAAAALFRSFSGRVVDGPGGGCGYFKYYTRSGGESSLGLIIMMCSRSTDIPTTAQTESHVELGSGHRRLHCLNAWSICCGGWWEWFTRIKVCAIAKESCIRNSNVKEGQLYWY